jgi:nitrate reductase gamma subunit
MGHEQRLAIFWVVHLALLGLFCLELLLVLSVWLKARVPGLPADASRWRKLGAALRFTASLIFSRRIWSLLRTLVVDGLVHRRLYRTNRRRWAVHLAVFGSWLVLGMLSILTGVVVEILPLLGMSPEAVASIPLFGHLFHADVWWVALLNELLGLLVLAGMLLVITRRYVHKDPQLRTMPADTAVIVLLTLVALGGFFAESFRLLADYTTAAGAFAPDPAMISPERLPPALYDAWGPQWGFAGYLLASLLGALRLTPGAWQTVYNLFFWLHFAAVTALLFTLPFSRFFHAIMSPVIVAYNTTVEKQARGAPRGQP